MAEKFLSCLGFQSSLANPDVWLRAATKGDGEQYYKYVLMYVDNILAISSDPEAIVRDVQTTFKLKNDKNRNAGILFGSQITRKAN
jgi:hypothetical protein